MTIKLEQFLKRISGKQEGGPVQVLYVEENPEDRTVSQYLNAYNDKIECVIETSVNTGINRLGLHKFDFVLLDYNLGEDSLEIMLEFLRNRKIPFAVISGVSLPPVTRRRLSAMSSFCISKDSLSEVPERILETVCLQTA